MNSFSSFPALSLSIAAMIFLVMVRSSEALKHNYYTRRDDRTLIGPLGFPFGFLDMGHYNLTVFDFQLSVPKTLHKHDPHHRRSMIGKSNNDNNEENAVALSEVLDNIRGVGFLLKQFKDEAAFHQYMRYIQEDPTRCVFQKYLDLKESETADDAMMRFYEDDYPIDDDFDSMVYDDNVIDDNYGGPYESDYDDYDYGVDNYEMDDDFGRFRGRDLTKEHKRPQQHSLQRRQKRRRLENGATRTLSDEEIVVGEEKEGYGEVIDAVKDGIYLDMLPRSRWRPHQPSVAYDFEPGQAGYYFLIYQVCYKDNVDPPENPLFDQVDKNNVLDIHSRFELDFHFSNQDIFHHVSYLSAGEMVFPYLFFVFSLLYGICVYVWFSNLKLIKKGKTGHFNTEVSWTKRLKGGQANIIPTIYPIHYLMGFLLVLKTLSLLFESIRFHYLRVTGHAVVSSAIYYTFVIFKGITLFTVILLIGSGWSFVKPFLSEREKKIILGILALQVINNIAIVVLSQETEGERSFDRWTAILHLVDILCCCAVLIPIVWQVNQLEKNMELNQQKTDNGNETSNGLEEDSFINDNRFDDDEYVPEDEFDNVPSHVEKTFDGGPTDARMAAKLKQFRSFYLLVIAYIYMTRIVVYLFATTLNYKHTWIRIFVVELTTFFFYTAVGYMFRPVNENPYLQIPRRQQDGVNGISAESQAVEMTKIDPASKVALD